MPRALLLVLVALLAPAAAHARGMAPGAPGAAADWAPADKHGFGTSATKASRVWFTLRRATLTEVYYPDLKHPSARGVDVAVDGKLADGKATISRNTLAYSQTITNPKWRLTRLYVTDPKRNTLLIRVHFEARDRKPHALTVAYDPQLYGNGDDDVGWTRRHTLLSHDAHVASALVGRPAFTRTSSGYAGRAGHLLEHDYDALEQGNVVQAARTTLTGLAHHQDLTLALAFGQTAIAARDTAGDSLDAGFTPLAQAYVAGWQAYRATLRPIPAAALPVADEYETSLLVLRASEDKTRRGEFVASPAASAAQVKATDLYQIGSALLAAGDTASANAAVDYLFDHMHSRDPLTIVLAWQLGRVDRWDGVKAAADEIVAKGTTDTPGEVADEIAGLVCAAGIARANHDEASAKAYEVKADAWAGAKLAASGDAGVLEFVRLGIRRAGDPQIVAAVGALAAPASPVLVGERGEYELAAGRPAAARLAQMAAGANDGGMIATGKAGSATPLAWAHAQFVRLAWSVEAGHPIETPAIVAARYTSAAK